MNMLPLIHSVDGYVGCSQVLAIMKSAAISILGVVFGVLMYYEKCLSIQEN